MAFPFASPVTVATLPDTVTLAVAGRDDVAEYLSASPSGSVKCPPTSTAAVLPASTSRSGIVPTGFGARFGTVTTNVCVAESPPGSVAVTDKVAVPLAMAVTISVLPATETAAAAGSDDVAP